MINIQEINEEIKRLENKDYLTYDIVNKLAALYTVKSHFKPATTKNSSSTELEMTKSMIK